MIKLSPFAPTPYCAPAMEVDGLYFVKAPGDKFLSIYVRYKNTTCWVPMHIGIPALQTLQQVRDADRNISINSGSYENAHFYLRSADGNNMTAAYFTNGDGGGIQIGNTAGYQPLDLQPLGGLLMYRGLEVATKSWVQNAGIFAPISHVGAGGSAHAVATTASAGFMSPTDKTKLDNLTQGITEETDPTVPAHVKAITTTNISNWNAKENSANKSTTTTLGTSNTLFPTQNAVKVYVDTAITNNNNNYVPLTQKGAANGVAMLGGDGKIPNAQLPALAITETFVVNSQAAMLALSSAGTGDIAVRTDINKSFILTNNSPGTLASWQELLSPTITNTDQVPEGTNNLYYTTSRARQSISAGNGISYNSTTGVITNAAPDQPSDLAIGTRTDTTMPVTNSNGTGITIPVATTTQAGLLSGTDKTKLNTLNNYTLPTASASVLGGIKVGSGLSINATTGVLSATNTANGTVTSVTGTAPVNVASGTTTPVISMTQSGTGANGWLSSTDWNKFNNKLDDPAGNANQFIDGTGAARDLIYKTPGTGTTYSGQYSKITRIEITSQYQDVNARIELSLFNYSLASQLRSEIWLRVKQQAAFGGDPVIEAIHENPMATAQYELYYAIVQNTPTTIVDVYVRPLANNYAICYYPIVWPKTGAGSSITFTSDSAYVSSVAGAIIFTSRVPASRDWVTAQGYLSVTPNLQQVATAGNTSAIDLNIGTGTNAVKVGAGTGIENTVLGKDALTAATATAYWNIAVGARALRALTAGRNNTAVGESSMASYISNPDNVNNNNTAIGNSSMLGNTSGKSNTAIGTNAGMTDALRDRGDYNVFLGSSAGYHTGTTTTALGNYNIILGPNAGVDESGSYKFIVGYNTVNEASTPFLYGDMAAGTLTVNADTTFSDTIKAPATPDYTAGGYTVLALNTTTGIVEKVSDLPFVPESTTMNAGSGLTGGGDLSTNRTIAMGTPSAVTLSSTNSASGTTHTHAFTPGGTTAQYIRGDGTLATFPAIPGTPNLQQVTDAGNTTTNNVMMAGQVTIGATSAPKTFAADAAFLPGFTPNTEIITGSSSGVAYSEAVVIRHNGSGGAGALQRELGLIFKMNADTNATESQKMGAIMMRSVNGFSNNPDMLFFTRNAERMRILDNGNIGVGTTSTLSKMEVARGAGSSADPIISASQNGGSIALKNGTGSGTQFAPVIQGTQVANNSWGLAIVGAGADTYSQAAVVVRGNNAAGDGGPTGKILSVQAYTSEVISMWANGNLKLTGGNVVLRDSNLKVVKNAASFRSATASTGAIVFKHAPAAPGAMITMKLEGYQYNSGRTFEITLSFYFNAATTISPTGKSAYLVASSTLPGLADVYAGFDADGNLSVIIGEITTAWSSYLHLWIDEVTISHTNYDNATWESGWSAALVSDLTGYTAITALGLKTIANQDWVTSILPAVNNGALSLATSGIATGSASFTANQTTGSTFTVNVPGTNIGSSASGGIISLSSSTGTGASINVLSDIGSANFPYQRLYSDTTNRPNTIYADSTAGQRTVDDLPSALYGGMTLAFKNTSALPGVGGSTYSTLLSFAPYTDATGMTAGGQLAFSSGGVYHRKNAGSSGSAWDSAGFKKLAYSGEDTLQSVTDSGHTTTNVLNVTGGALGRQSAMTPGDFRITAASTGGLATGYAQYDTTGAIKLSEWGFFTDPSSLTYGYFGVGSGTGLHSGAAFKVNATGVGVGLPGATAPSMPLEIIRTATDSNPLQKWSRNTADGYLQVSSFASANFAPALVGNNTVTNLPAFGVRAFGKDSFGTSAAIILRAGNSGYTAGITGGSVLKVQNYTTDYLDIDYQGVITAANLSGMGTRIVVADSSGKLSTMTSPATPTLQSVTDAGNNTTNEVQFSNTVFFPGSGAQFFANGTGDGASYSTYNMKVHGHWGWAFEDNTNTIRGVLDFRTGTLDMQGGFVTAGILKAGSLSGSGTRMVTATADGTLGTAAVPTYTGSTSITLSGTSFQRAALTGDVTAAANSNATTIATNAVTLAKMADIVTNSILGRYSAGTGDPQVVTVGEGLAFSSTSLTTKVSYRSGTITMPLSVSAFSAITFNIPVSGAALGMPADIYLDTSIAAAAVPLICKAVVSATDTVTVHVFNASNGSVTLAAAPYKAVAWILE